MNTSTLKRFAQSARRKLMDQVAAKIEYVLTADSAELREKAAQINELKKELNHTTRALLIERVAYTWFNRLVALRFMDANDYQPTGIRVISPAEGTILPQLLNEAKQGNIPSDWKVNTQKVYDLLDGRIPASNPQNEAYRELLIAACNNLHTIFPFLFERINDYTELLLPDDLTSQFSIVHDVVEGIPAEDCQQVEVLGWLYQFYISEEKERLINAKKKYKAHEIAPVTQLFTPHWIVRYMVDNTLGQLWKEMRPNSKLPGSLEFYIKPENESLLPKRVYKSPEEISFFDPCSGSGHIMTYAFDLFYKIYEEEGYNPSEIPGLIITKNLFGADIDERAAQLAGFALMMKGRQYYRRFLNKPVIPNIVAFQNFTDDPFFNNAKVLGSLIQVDENYVNKIKVDNTSLFGETNLQLKKQAELLAQKYDVVVTNPPYMNSSVMEDELKEYIEKNFENTKSDLFATFVSRCLELVNQDGLTGFMTPFVWMFISSYEKLRQIIIENHFINNLIQLEYSGFDGATVPICTFTLRNNYIEKLKGSYIRLSDFKGAQNQAPKTLEAIQNPNCGWFYNASQTDFQKITGNPFGYWVKPKFLEIFKKGKLKSILGSDGQLLTGNNERFIRFLWEVESSKIGKDLHWKLHHKGGEFRKWYGNLFWVVKWDKGTREFYRKDKTARIPKENLWDMEGITWSTISSSSVSFRKVLSEENFNKAAPTLITGDSNLINYITPLLNSKVTKYILSVYNPTLNYLVQDIENIPVHETIIGKNEVKEGFESCLKFSRNDWKSKETSWDFERNELLKQAGSNNQIYLEEASQRFQKQCTGQFLQLHQNEEELNRQFIEIYGLQEELTPDVPLEEITILQNELDRKALEKLNKRLQRESGTLKVLNYHEIKLPFDAKEIMAQFVSYAVGCMFGRYSLEKPGLILANQRETLDDYIAKVQNGSEVSPHRGDGRGALALSFLPDADNIIPILDDEWFEDDIVARFKSFLKASFGEENFDRNLRFVEECLGKDMQRYFARDFYTDHVRRYKKRPIYWMFSSPQGSFNALIYMHRYTPDTISLMLNNYLRAYQEKLRAHRQHLERVQISGTTAEKTQALKETERIDKLLLELQSYERDILFPLATSRITINLDDGVLVNYNKFGKAIKEVAGLNDKPTKKKVREFDWIDVGEIRD